MKKSALILTLLCAALSCASSFAKPSGVQLDNIVAVVNDDVVTQTELNRALNIIKLQQAQTHAPVNGKDSLQKQALDQPDPCLLDT